MSHLRSMRTQRKPPSESILISPGRGSVKSILTPKPSGMSGANEVDWETKVQLLSRMHAKHGNVSMRTKTSGLMKRSLVIRHTNDPRTFWSAVTCHRFGLSRPVATTVAFGRSRAGRQAALEAVTGHRTPKEISLF